MKETKLGKPNKVQEPEVFAIPGDRGVDYVFTIRAVNFFDGHEGCDGEITQHGGLLIQLRDLLRQIRQSRKGGIGAPDNVYLPRLSVKRVDKLGKMLEKVLGGED